MRILEVRECRTAYGDLEVLHGVSLEVESEEIVALVGANGAGKTTLINCVGGIIHIRTGEVLFQGERIEHLKAHDVVERGLIQVPEGRRIFPRMNVAENLELGAYSSRARSKRQGSSDFVLRLFPRLEERQKQLAGTLSGGEQQMLAIGRALMASPRMLMLDEPSQGLAPILVKQVLEAVKVINGTGCTILIVEQNVEDALAISNRGYVLQTGKVVMAGSSRSLFEDPAFREAYFGIK
jgi:branched-chain amino acid transport system ATP-binding protein